MNFNTNETITVVPSRMGRPAVNERFEPRARIVENERWLSVYVGNERIEKIGLDSPNAWEKARAVKDRVVADFHAAVEEHNRKVLEAKEAAKLAEAAEHARAIAALDAEYGAIRQEIAEDHDAHVKTAMGEEAPVETAQEGAEEAPAPTATQIDRPAARVSSVVRRPASRKPVAKAATKATPRKRGSK